MLKNQAARFFLRQTSGPDRVFMSTTTSVLTTIDPFANQRLHIPPVQTSLHLNDFAKRFHIQPAQTGFSGSALHLRNTVDVSGSSKARAFDFASSYLPQLVRHSEICDDKLMNERATCQQGRSLTFPDRPLSEKMVVAVDVDEVLGNFISALNRFIADRYSLNHSVSEYHVYEFFKIWNCSRDEADIRVHEFFKTPYFKKGIHPIPGAWQVLNKLSKFCNLAVVTSRQNAIKEQTIEWIENHYPKLFQEIHFGNHFALDGETRSKSDICRSLGAKVLIDDNPRYAIECAEAGIRVLLFDYENSYPWSKSNSTDKHPLVTKVHNWVEVEQQLVSGIFP